MDFLDPKKQRAHMIRLMIGYVLIAVAIIIATSILLRIAFGFGLGKDGQVVQNGFVFVSSQPDGSQVYVNGKLYKDTTGTRLQLPEGKYTLDIKKDGYTSWHRDIAVQGGMVVRYDYPFMVPASLTPAPVTTYSAAPALATESPDRHWMVVEKPGSLLDFDLYDISNAKQVSAKLTSISIPSSVVTSSDAADGSWKLTEWSNDNRHVVLQHTFGTESEYVLVDTQDPAKSQNLTRTLGLSAGQILSLIDKKFDRYYIFNPAAKSLDSATLDGGTTLSPVLTGVLAFKSYGDNRILYATEEQASPGQVTTMLKDGDVTYKIREVTAGGPYLLDLAQYSGDWYVAVGSGVDNKVYVYKNPQATRKAGTLKNLVPVRILRVTAPDYIEFSSNTRFIMVENAASFAVYDAEYDKGYTYTSNYPLDAPQTHATWMDGDRIMYVSGGRAVIFDYDSLNPQALVAANPAYLFFFDRDYHNLYTLTPPTSATGDSVLDQTALLLPSDQ